MPDVPASPWRPTTRRARIAHRWQAARRAVLARRRPLAAVATAIAVYAVVRALAPLPPATVELLVAAGDLPSGSVVAQADRVATQVDPDAVPDGVAADPVGRILAGAVRRGEALTDVRFVGPELTAGHDDLVVVPLRLPDPGAVALLTVGDRIDLVATEPDGSGASVVAAGVTVLALPAGDPESGSSGLTASGLAGRLVVIGAPEGSVAAISGAAVANYLSFTFAG